MRISFATLALAASLAVVALVGGCSEPASEEVDFGTVTGSTYSNEYFGLEMDFPEGWSVQNREEQQRLMETGSALVAGDDESMSAMIKAAQPQTVQMFAVFEHPMGSAVPFNPSCMGVAERVRHMPGVKRGKDYHFHMRRVLEAGAMKVDFPGEITTETLGGREFDVMAVDITSMGQVIHQRQYATISKGYALLIAVTFQGDEPSPELQDALASVRFR